jgi:integrase
MALPTLRPVKHPRYRWRISYSDPRQRTASGRPKEIHRYFNDEAEAKRALAKMGGVVAEQGVAGLLLSPTLRRDALDARAKLDAAGFTSTSLVAAADKFLGSQAAGPAARQLVTPFLDVFLDHKVHEENASIQTRDNLEHRVGSWLDWQKIVTLADITPERCIALRSRRGAGGATLAEQTRKNDMNAVSSFLTWLVRDAKVLAQNPLLGQRRPKVQRGRPELYLPATCQRILDAAARYKDGRHARAVGLLFLAGLRPSEVPHALLRTEARPPVVRVEGGKMRGRANRVVELSPGGAAWLAAQPAGIHPPTTGERRQICRLAGGVEWIQDGARHTWISAKCEMEQNDGRVARMAGTSEGIIHAHYHALMSRAAARAVERLGLPRVKKKKKLTETRSRVRTRP